jgi:hypothetical protein
MQKIEERPSEEFQDDSRGSDKHNRGNAEDPYIETHETIGDES